MTGDKTLREALLKQNGIVPGEVSDEERERIRRTLARDRARVRRMKWGAIIAWLALPLLYLLGYVIAALGAGLGTGTIGEEIMILTYVAGPYIAIVFTISYFLRSRSLSSRQIQAKLADIEEQLRRISEGQKTEPPQ